MRSILKQQFINTRPAGFRLHPRRKPTGLVFIYPTPKPIFQSMRFAHHFNIKISEFFKIRELILNMKKTNPTQSNRSIVMACQIKENYFFLSGPNGPLGVASAFIHDENNKPVVWSDDYILTVPSVRAFLAECAAGMLNTCVDDVAVVFYGEDAK